MSDHLEQVTYTPESALRSPRQLLRSMFRDLLASRELAWRLLVRNLSARYRQSALGYLWAFLPPIATTATFVFLQGSGITGFEETALPYVPFVLIGTVYWQTFVDALNGPIRLVRDSRSFLAKINFPRESLVLAAVGEVMFNFAVRLAIVVPVLAYYRLAPDAAIVALPLVLALLVLLGTAIGIVLTPAAVLFDDIEWGLALVISLWFFVTPVAYPTPTSGAARYLSTWNPVAPVLSAARDLTAGTPVGAWMPVLVVATVVAAFLGCGWVLYRLAMPHLIARISA